MKKNPSKEMWRVRVGRGTPSGFARCRLVVEMAGATRPLNLARSLAHV